MKNTFQDMNEEFVLYVIIPIEVFLLDTKGRRIRLEVYLIGYSVNFKRRRF